MKWLNFPLILSFLSLVYCDCVIMSEYGAAPSHVTGDDAKPKDYSTEWGNLIACPEFKDTLSCCNGAFNEDNYKNFKKLETAFGNHGGGCDVCAANIERFYCYYACSPHQSDFMTFNGYKTVLVINDTTGLPVNITAADISLSLNGDHACKIFESCSKIAFLTQISAGSSALGFITFQFDRGITDSYSQVHVTLKNIGGLNFTTPPHSCNKTFPTGKDEFGYEIPGKCSCNSCSDSCAPLEMVPYGSIIEGFDYYRIILTYFLAALLTIGCHLLRRFKQRSKVSYSEPEIQRSLLDDVTNMPHQDEKNIRKVTNMND